MYLTKAKIISLLDEIDLKPSKQRGQNFLFDQGILEFTSNLSQILPNDHILEIGPGLGSLTVQLLKTGAKVTAIEIEPAFAKLLPETISKAIPEFSKNLTVINMDALNLRPEDLANLHSASDQNNKQINPTKLIANLPYNLAAPLLLDTLRKFPSINEAIIMTQTEVSERLSALPGGKIYGIPSAKLRYFGKSKIVKKVPRNVFYPVPGVDSSILHFERTSDFPVELADLTFEIVDLSFANRRKMLKSNLQQLPNIQNVLRSLDVCESDRAENLETADFYKIANFYRNSVTVLVPAKINLDLKILGKDEVSGKHLLKTVFHSIQENLGEIVTVQKSPELALAIQTLDAEQFAKLPADNSENIAWKAAQKFFALAKQTAGASIFIDKKTPIQAGLAGGSADAAGVLLGLNRLFGSPLSLATLQKVAAELGADVAFFLNRSYFWNEENTVKNNTEKNNTAIGEGFGEIITEISPHKLDMLIIAFEKGLSTSEIFNLYDSEKLEKDKNNHNLNDLQSFAISKMPEIQSVIDFCLANSAEKAFMTGSGPSVVAISQNLDATKRLAKKFDEKIKNEFGISRIIVTQSA